MRQRTTVLGRPATTTGLWEGWRALGLTDLPLHHPTFRSPATFGVAEGSALTPATRFRLDHGAPLAAYLAVRRLGFEVRPVLPGPLAFLRSTGGRSAGGPGFDPLSLLEAFLEPYAELLERLATAGAQEVQLDEPAPADPAGLRRLARVYRRLGELSNRPRLMVCLCSGEAGPALAVLGGSRVESIALDFVTAPGALDALTRMGGLPRTTVVAAVVDGRSPHTGPVESAAATCATISGLADRLVVAASCSPRQPAPLETAATVVRVGLGHA
ncbi:hypothetical protein ACIBHY_52775 [Nonomuraea sp. NPDC050547]|uniref:hypothetical protein n=1 Tax=Nonomuraea sp. NPDC050547 TaxID=3364368 RepID=UPI0037A83155